MVNSGIKKFVGFIGVSFLIALNNFTGGSKENSDRLSNYIRNLLSDSKKMNYMATNSSRKHAIISS